MVNNILLEHVHKTIIACIFSLKLDIDIHSSYSLYTQMKCIQSDIM